jgi:hypothetical protein
VAGWPDELADAEPPRDVFDAIATRPVDAAPLP